MKVIIVKMYTEIISGAGEKSVSYQVHSNRKTICWCSSPTHLVQSSKAWELGKYNLLDSTYAFSKPQLIFTLDTIRYKFPPQKISLSFSSKWIKRFIFLYGKQGPSFKFVFNGTSEEWSSFRIRKWSYHIYYGLRNWKSICVVK